MVAEHCEIDVDMILHFEAAQNFVAKHYESRFWHDIPLKCSSKIGCRTLSKWFLHDFSFKSGSTLGCRALYERNFDMIFHFMAAQKLVAGYYERDFDLILRLKADQNLVVEHCEWDFYMIFHFKEAQHLVAEHSEIFWHNFSLYGGWKRSCRALWKRKRSAAKFWAAFTWKIMSKSLF